MKKIIVGIVVLSLALIGWRYVKIPRLGISALEGKTNKVKRGDLIIPITASGTVQPDSRTEIKSKASGEVIKIAFKPGDMVKKGDVLIELKKIDEERSYALKKTDYDKAVANLNKAKVLLKQKRESQPVEVKIAESRLKSAQARETQAKANWDHIRELPDDVKKDQEVVLTEALWKETVGQRELAESELDRAKIGEESIKVAEHDAELAQETVNAAKIALDDALERLNETTVISPVNGMISDILVQEGEIIKSGKTSIMGGDVLLTIADISEMYVVAEVDEADIGTVRQLAPSSARPGPKKKAGGTDDKVDTPLEVGTSVKVTSDAFRTEEDEYEIFEGIIERILPEPKIRSAIVTYDVEIRLTSDNCHKLFLGMQTDVEFVTESIKDALLVPQDALRTEPGGDRLGVFIPVPRENGTGNEPKFIPLKTGVTNGFVTEVIEGNIKEGDQVYTKLPIKTAKQQERERKMREEG